MFQNPKVIFASALAVAVGWMFASNLQKVFNGLFPSIEPIHWVMFAIILSYIGWVKLK